MINKFRKWLSKKGIIKLKIIEDSNQYYCPLCLSDIERTARGLTTQCPKCNTIIYY